MKLINYLSILYFLLSGISLIAQCPNFGVTLRTQADVDEFVNDYPNCEYINGTLTIGSLHQNPPSLDISDISGLNGIKGIKGNLDINNCDSLTSINAFNQLDSIGGTLYITHHENIGTIDDFHSLKYIGGSLLIYVNANLQHVSDFELVDFIGGRIEIQYNPQILSIEGFNVITQISGGGLSIRSGPLLSTINAFQNLHTTNGSLSLGELPMTNVDFLQNVTNVYNGLFGIQHFPNLDNINGLQNLETIGLRLFIIDCEILTDLSPLSNLTDVETLIIKDTGVQNLNGLQNSNVGQRGGLEITGNPSLESLDGLNPYHTFAKDILISGNHLLSDISSLNGIDTIHGAFSQALHIGSTLVTNLDNFEGLKYLGSHLTISSNPLLENIDGLFDLNYVDGRVSVNNNLLLDDCYGICPLLNEGTIENSISISNNLTGCNSTSEITAENCEANCSNNLQNDYSYSLDFPGCSILIFPQDLLAGSSNCLGVNYQFIDGSNISANLEYTCDDTGVHSVQFFYNTDTLETLINIIDTYGYCKQDSIQVSGDINGNQIFTAGEYLESNANINSFSNAIFESGQEVVLLEDFEVEISTTFHTYINTMVCH